MNTAHSERRNFITGFFVFAFVALPGLFIYGCKKQVDESEKEIEKVIYARVVDVDKDGKELSSPIVWDNTTGLDIEGNDNGDMSQPLGYQHWLENYRKWWCENAGNPRNPWYCVICKEYPECISTPVKFLSVTLSNNVIKWETAEESGIDYFRIDISADGKVFKEKGRVSPKGNGIYTFTIKP